MGTALLGPCVNGSALPLVAFDDPVVLPDALYNAVDVRHQTAALFRPHLNTRFDVESPCGERVPLVLSAVSERRSTGELEQFSLLFDAPHDAARLGGTHPFQHAVLGRFDLFVAPVGGGDTTYEVCFSRLIRGGAEQRAPIKQIRVRRGELPTCPTRS